MLETLARKKSLAPLSTTRCRSCPAFAGPGNGRALEFASGAARAFFSAKKRIAKHSGHSVFPAQKVHLESVRLFLGPRFGVDAADVRFRVGIRSSSHE